MGKGARAGNWSSVLASGPARQGTGSLQLPLPLTNKLERPHPSIHPSIIRGLQNAHLLVSPSPLPGAAFSRRQPAPARTIRPRFCTRLAARGEGYPPTPEPSNLASFSIVCVRRRAWHFAAPKGRGPQAPPPPQTGESPRGPRRGPRRARLAPLGFSMGAVAPIADAQPQIKPARPDAPPDVRRATCDVRAPPLSPHFHGRTSSTDGPRPGRSSAQLRSAQLGALGTDWAPQPHLSALLEMR